MTFSNDQSKPLNVFIISDSIGETAHRAVRAALVQFSYDEEINVQQFPFINHVDDLLPVLEDARKENAIIVTTLISNGLNQFCAEYARDNDIEHFDYLNGLVKSIEDRTKLKPANHAGALHTMDKDYFDRIEAIEFAVKYDDGKNPAGLLKADLVILGVSRTSKTPLSIFLANKAYKVTNLPIVPEVNLPKVLYEVPHDRIVGLYASPEYIRRIRSERIRMMGLKSDSSYNNLERIRYELNYFNDLVAQLRAPVINIENRSVEETAQHIEEIILNRDR